MLFKRLLSRAPLNPFPPGGIAEFTNRTGFAEFPNCPQGVQGQRKNIKNGRSLASRTSRPACSRSPAETACYHAHDLDAPLRGLRIARSSTTASKHYSRTQRGIQSSKLPSHTACSAQRHDCKRRRRGGGLCGSLDNMWKNRAGLCKQPNRGAR